MNRAFRISIITLALFAVVVFVTAKEERSIDGNDVYGYPLIFLTEYGGLVAGPASRSSAFSFFSLVIDLLPITVIAIFIERPMADAIIYDNTENNEI